MMVDRPVMCAVCHCPVALLERMEDISNMTTIFTAYCHGATERTVLSVHEMVIATEIIPMVAFASPASLEDKTA